jgi:ABC-2 type transport system ATP-binding protein
VVIDAGQLRASDSIASYTRAQQLLAVEVDGGPQARDALAARLADLNIKADADGRALVVALPLDNPDAIYDTLRDAVADLGLALVRLEQRRHRLSDMFSDHPRSSREGRAGV